MKNILLVLALMLSIPSFGQIKSAELTASGLTCSMCSKAIYKSLVKIPVIQDIKVDIKKSSYLITFRDKAEVSLDVIKKAVEDAGFSVASLKVTANFDEVEVGQNAQVNLQGNYYRFINVSKQTLQGVKTFEVVDKNYLPVKEYRKYEKSVVAESGGKRIYNVTLSKI